MRHRFLTVPYNDQGIAEYNSGVEKARTCILWNCQKTSSLLWSILSE